MDTPTIYDVSRLSGVSTATVSRTFTTPDRVRESTRRRVYAAAEALHYQPSAIARAMARQQTDKIAFLICKEGATILDEFYASICEGVMRRANGTNYQLLISTAEEWTRTAQSKQIEGVILAGNAQADLISEFQRQNIPVVLVNNRAAGFDLPCIVADEAGGLEKILNILGENDINLEYTYAFITRKKGTAYMVFRVQDNDKAIEILSKNHVHLVCQDAFSEL